MRLSSSRVAEGGFGDEAREATDSVLKNRISKPGKCLSLQGKMKMNSETDTDVNSMKVRMKKKTGNGIS